MTERKSSRARKTVKYAGIDEESDDDFADAKPSKSKKQKVLEDDGKKKSKQKSMENIDMGDSSTSLDEPSSISKRKTLKEKVYEKELQEALQLSILETSGCENPNDTSASSTPIPTPTGADKVQVEVEVAYAKAPQLTLIEEENLQAEKEESPSFDKEPPLLVPLNSSTLGTVMDDSIECVEDKEMEPEIGSRRQRRAAKKTVIIDDDDDSGDESDFKPENQPDSDVSNDDNDDDEEEEADDDSDFDDHKSNKKQKGNTKKKPAPAIKKKATSSAKKDKPVTASVKQSAQTNVKTATPVAAKVTTAKVPTSRQPQSTSSGIKTNSSAHLSSPVSSKTSAVKSSINSPVTSIKRQTESLIQSWKAPGRATNSNSSSSSIIKSPSSGLRLGLSRNQRVKPLHSNV